MNQINNVEYYLKIKSSKSRIDFLNNTLKKYPFMPIELVEDLMCLELLLEEKIALIKATNNSNNIDFELLLINNILNHDQIVGVTAIKEWATRSQKLLWFIMPKIILDNNSTQRIKFTILNLIDTIKALPIIQTFTKLPDLNEYSPALHNLLLKKAITYNYEHPSLQQLAQKYINQLDNEENSKIIPSAILYLAKFKFEYLLSISPKTNTHWIHFIQTIIKVIEQQESILNQNDTYINSTKNINIQELQKIWPPIYLRHLIKPKVINKLLINLIKDKNNIDIIKELFEGVCPTTITEAFLKINDKDEFLNSLKLIKHLILIPYSDALLHKIEHNIKFLNKKSFKTQDILDPRISLIISNIKNNISDIHNLIYKHHINTIKLFDTKIFNNLTAAQLNSSITKIFKNINSVKKSTQDKLHISTRKIFFNIAFKQNFINLNKINNKNDYWYELYNIVQMYNSNTLEDTNIDNIATLARQTYHIYQLCFLYILRFFKHSNKAFLKLLDYIRSDDPVELYYIIYALGGIQTQRALQELINLITRNNIPINLKFEIINLIKNCDLSQVQKELISAINDIQTSPNTNDPIYEIKENLKSLLIFNEYQSYVHQDIQSLSATEPNINLSLNTQNNLAIESSLEKTIDNYKELSSDAKRALRTAKFFEYQIHNTNIQTLLDLTPLIEMQYKALELLFRENLEHFCKSVIENGIIQKKLDLLGYARLVEHKINHFENYIISLPIIQNIPFFSKFKLRKMLISLSQHNTKKRFTLDSIKAFAIFLLCFARKQCSFNLNNIIEIPNITDKKLFEWIKEIHIFQDLRNRAAHEGYSLDSNITINDIWQSTSKIIKILYLIKDNIKSPYVNS